MRSFEQIYFSLILEEVLEDANLSTRIDALPTPLCTYFNEMKTSMLKAANAKSDEEYTAVNTEVNTWRDKIIDFWQKNAAKLKDFIKQEINDILMIIVSRYTELMNGCNTGYA